nr:amino-terminal enhancer of split [Loxodonta africana]
MVAGRRPSPRGLCSEASALQGSSHLPQQLKFTTSDSCDRIKDEFQLLQAQYHRGCVLQAEIVKRLNGICAQVLPYLSQEHQQQVLGAIERAKQVTAPELNSIIRVCQGVGL